MRRLDVSLLGPFEFRLDGTVLSGFGLRQRGVLALLCLSPGKPVHVDRVIDGLWGDEPPENARNVVQVYVSQWRRIFQATKSDLTIRYSQSGYLLPLSDDDVDFNRLERLVDLGQELLKERLFHQAVAVLDDASSHVKGEPLQDMVGLPLSNWVRPKARELIRRTNLLRVEAKLAIGDVVSQIASLEQLVDASPWDEQFVALLMRSLYLSGRQRDALGVYEKARRELELYGLLPSPRLVDEESRILRHDPDLLRVTPAPRTVPSLLPEPKSPYRGERSVVENVVGAIDTGTSRVVTLAALGGMGKTALAVEAARTLSTEWDYSVVYLPLDNTRRERGLLAQLAVRLGLSEAWQSRSLFEICSHAIRGKSLVLIDGAESAIESVREFVGELATAAPQLRVLVTSRMRMASLDERVIEVQPLRVALESGEDWAEVPGVALFLDRFSLDAPVRARDKELLMVAEICGLVDGIPLAIEIAAARARTIGLSAALAGIRDRLRFLTLDSSHPSDTPRSLENILRSTFSLLSPPAQLLLPKLAVPVGGVTLSLAHEIGADPHLGRTFDLVEELVHYGFLHRRREPGGVRFSILPIVNEFVTRTLTARERDEVWARYEKWLTREFGDLGTSPERGAVLFLELEGEAESVRLLMEAHLRSRRWIRAGRFCLLIYSWWMFAGRRREVRSWLECCLVEAKTTVSLRPQLGLLAGRAAAQCAEYERSVELLALVSSFSAQTGSSHVVEATIAQSENHALLGRFDVAESLIKSVQGDVLRSGDPRLELRFGLAKALHSQLTGDHVVAEGILSYLQELPLLSDWPDALVKVQVARSEALRMQGRLTEAREILQRTFSVVTTARSSDLMELVHGHLAVLAAVELNQRDVLKHGITCLGAVPSIDRDVESTLRVALAVEAIGSTSPVQLKVTASQLADCLLREFPAPAVAASEQRFFSRDYLREVADETQSDEWVTLADNLLYELKRAVAMGSVG